MSNSIEQISSTTMEPNNNAEDCKDGPIMSLDDQLHYTYDVAEVFFSNRFKDHMDMYNKYAVPGKTLNLNVGKSYGPFMFAVFSMEKDAIEEAKILLKEAESTANNFRRPSSLVNLIFKPKYADFTDEQAHAEAILSEIHFMNFVLSFIDEPSLLTIVKGALKLRNLYNCLTVCRHVAEQKTQWTSDWSRENFMSALKMNWGFYNLLIGHMPSRIIKLMAFVGFESDSTSGMTICKDVTTNYRHTFRFRTMTFLVVFYSFYLEQFFSLGTADFDWVRDLCDESLRRTPGSVFDLFWGARTEQMTGDPNKAITMFNQIMSTPGEYSGMNNVCHWDKLWSHALLGQWAEASASAEYLSQNCKWSKSTNLYQLACFKYMALDAAGGDGVDQITPPTSEIMDILKKVPEFKNKLGGKTIPPEKFAITKAKSIVNGTEDMVMCVLDLYYIWNIYTQTKGKDDLINPILDQINRKIKLYPKGSDKYFNLMLHKGVCNKMAGKHDRAIEIFEYILDNEVAIKTLTYVPPHAAMEMGLTLLESGDLARSKQWLESARDNYSGFLIESQVHLRIHAALQKIQKIERS